MSERSSKQDDQFEGFKYFNYELDPIYSPSEGLMFQKFVAEREIDWDDDEDEEF